MGDPGLPQAVRVRIQLAANEPGNGPVFSVSPNPTSGAFELRFGAGQDISNYRLRVISALGQIISDQPVSGYSSVRIDLSGQPDGYYLVQIADQKGSRTERVLLSRR